MLPSVFVQTSLAMRGGFLGVLAVSAAEMRFVSAAEMWFVSAVEMWFDAEVTRIHVLGFQTMTS